MKKIIATVCALFLIMSVSLTAFADTEINNSILGEPGMSTPATALLSGADLIRQTGDQEKIAMPNYQDFYENPAVRYVDAPKNHSIYVYRNPGLSLADQISSSNLMPSAHEGLKVLAVAQQGGMSCIIYHDRDFNPHAGWVESRHLVSSFPGNEVFIGDSSASDSTELEVPQMGWSKEPFVGTNQKYVLLQEPVENCVQFKLAYQVTNTYTIRFDDTLGTRTIYVNDGSGWISVGKFEYYAQGAVLVTVNLKEAVDLKAVAVIPECNEPDGFLDRIEIQNVSRINSDESDETWVQIYSYSDYGDSSKETEYHYDENQYVTEIIRHEINRDGTESFTETKRSFDQNGMITGSETRDSETGELTETELWYYTPEKELERICTYGWTGTLKREQINSYFSDGYEIKCVDYDDNGDISSRTIMQFDSNGNKLSSEYYDESDELAVRIEYTYNSDNEKEKEVTLDTSGNTLYAKKYSYTYNSDGLSEEATGIYTNGILGETKEIIRYSYDKYGNLTQETMIYDGKESYHTNYRWGLLESGRIVQISE